MRSKIYIFTKMVIYFVTFLIFAASDFPGSYETLTVSPQNTAVISGSQATFMCTSNLTSPHAWTWTSSSMPSSIVFNQSSCVLSNASYSQIFSLDSTSPGTCNLIVKTASISEVGKYTCGDLGSNPPNTASAVLTVLESRPICSISNTTNSIVYNSSSNVLQMECSVSYSTYSSSNEPQLSWSHSPGPSIAFNTTFSYSLLEAPLTIPQTSSETCTLSFNPPTGLSGTNYATNTPSFTSTCNTPVVYPMYCPVNISISQSDGTLNCSAQSNPAATYQWHGPITSNTSTVVASEVGNYTCVATNGALNCRSSSNYTVDSVNDTTSMTTDAATSSTTSPGDPSNVGAIVGSIFGVLIVVAAGSGFTVIIVWKRRRSNKFKNSDSKTLRSSHSDGLNENQPQNAAFDGFVYGHIQLDAHVSGLKRRKPVHLLIGGQEARDIYAVIIRA